MAVTEFGTNDAKTVKVWSRKTEYETLPMTLAGQFLGESKDSGIVVFDELNKGPGDRVRITQKELFSGEGVNSTQTLEGNEATPSYNTDDVELEELAYAVRYKGRLTAQRTALNLREDAKVDNRDFFADRFDRGFINQLTGNTIETETKKTGNMSPVAPSSNHILYGGNATSVATLNAGDEFTLDLLDRAEEKIDMMNESGEGYQFRPMKGGRYACIMSPRQKADLRTNTSTGQWQDIQLAAMKGGRYKENLLFSKFLGEYGPFDLFVNSRIPKCNNSGAYFDNSRAAVVFGAMACAVSFGRETPGSERFSWVEETFDYGREHGVSAALIFGMTKLVFNSIDNATMVLNTYTTND